MRSLLLLVLVLYNINLTFELLGVLASSLETWSLAIFISLFHLKTRYITCCAIWTKQAALDASGRGGKGGGKGDRAQGISQGVNTIDQAIAAAKDPSF